MRDQWSKQWNIAFGNKKCFVFIGPLVNMYCFIETLVSLFERYIIIVLPHAAGPTWRHDMIYDSYIWVMMLFMTPVGVMIRFRTPPMTS